MRIALVYDLRDDYRALGFTEEEVAEFDSDRHHRRARAGALAALGCEVERVGHGRRLPRGLSPAIAGISCSPSPRA